MGVLFKVKSSAHNKVRSVFCVFLSQVFYTPRYKSVCVAL